MREEKLNETDLLVLWYRNPETHSEYSKRDKKLKKLLINSFFERCDDQNKLPVESNDMRSRLSLDEFYDALKNAHKNDDLVTNIPQNVQHPSLRPVLRPYQVRGIKFMLKRELQTDHLPTCYVKLRPKFRSTQTYFYDTFSGKLLAEHPDLEEIPPGGFLTGIYDGLSSFHYVIHSL